MKSVVSSLLLSQLLNVAVSASAEDFIEITVQGNLSVEMRAALANALEPSKNYGSIVEAFNNTSDTVFNFIEPIVAFGALPLSDGPCNGGMCSASIGRVTDPSQLNGKRISSGTMANPTGIQDFLVLDRNSTFSRAFGGSSMATNAPNLQIPSVTMERMIVPVDPDPTDISTFPKFDCNFDPAKPWKCELVAGVISVPESVVSELAALEKDIQEIGRTTRVIRRHPDLSDEGFELLKSVFSASGLASINLSDKASVVFQELPDNAVVQTATGGECGTGLQNWPFNTDKLARLINQNLAVMKQAGLTRFRRSKVLVVDSGLPEALAKDSGFSEYLISDPEATLRQEYFWRNKSDSEPVCDIGPAKGHSRFGFFPVKTGSNGCIALDKLGGLVPPNPHSSSPEYIADHGGLVSVVAVGGPSLFSKVEELDQLVGVGFARIMRESENGVVADPADISRAMSYAADEGFIIVNASLRATSRGADVFTEAFDKFGENGLVIAAAGNSSGPLETASTVFPANLAQADGNNDSLIVVGGIQREPSGSTLIEPWPQSSFSNKLVDIAAPASNVMSLNGDGNLACFSGTSIAAPQVSFAASMLYAMGYSNPGEIRRRILATSRIDNQLIDLVREGRVLDVLHALDVFADLVWLDTDPEPRRVRILPLEDGSPIHVIKLCDPSGSSLESPDGWLDPAKLHLWSKTTDNDAIIWHDDRNRITSISNQCKIPDSFIRMEIIDGATTRVESVALSRIQRIVPSRLRRALDMAWE